MKYEIYCNEGSLWITDSKPVSAREGEVQLQYSGRKALKEAVYEFEKGEKQRILTLWSEDRPGDLLAAVFSLYDIVEAAGGVVFNEHGEILFIHRNGKWDLPKGKVSGKDRRLAEEKFAGKPAKQESTDLDAMVARIAALREVKEETGLKSLSISNELPPTYHIYFTKDRRIIKHTRWFRMEASTEDTLKPQISEGIIIARWIPTNSLGCIFVHTYESLKPLIKSVLSNT